MGFRYNVFEEKIGSKIMKKTMVVFLFLFVSVCLSSCSKRELNPLNTEKDQVKSPSVELPKEEKTLKTALPETEQISEKKKKINEIDLADYFDGINGCAVFYNPKNLEYNIYNPNLSETASSPCSTFKIISSLIGMESNVIDLKHSVLKWSGEVFWNEDWNRDIDFEQAFRTSCIWYFRQVINEVGESETERFLKELDYGNCDISDWEGRENTNNNNRSLTGFWVESSLKISPKEQAEVLSDIFEDNEQYSAAHINALKKAMLIKDAECNVDIYGKTGLGVKDGKTVDAWFVGMYEEEGQTVYFAVRLDDPENKESSSKKAKEIAINIINEMHSQWIYE